MAECTCANPTLVSDAVKKHDEHTVNATKESTKTIDETLYSAARGGQHGRLIVSNCDWAAPQWGGIGESKWTDFFQAAALVIAIANGVAQSEIADKRQDLADRYYRMAKYKWDRFAGNYMPLEKQLLAEVSSTPVRNIDCAGAHDRAGVAVNTAYDNMDTYLVRMAKAYRVCVDDSYLQYNQNRRNLMEVDTENYNLSDERWFTDVKNDQRWNRRSNVLNLGRNLSSQALAYGDVANSLMKTVGSQLDRAAGGVVQAFGYYGARNDTYYPTEYLNTAQGLNTNIVQVGTPGSLNAGGLNPAGGA